MGLSRTVSEINGDFSRADRVPLGIGYYRCTE